jgi:dienelactone hydrolase
MKTFRPLRDTKFGQTSMTPSDSRKEWIRTQDGLRLSAIWARPGSSKVHRGVVHRGVVILVHGFAAEKDEKGLFPPVEESLIERGYCVLRYDWRGLGESEGDFSATKLATHVDDFKDVVQWVFEQTGSTAENMSAVGFSLGATIVGLALSDGTQLGSASFWSPALMPDRDMWPRYNTPEIRQQLRDCGYILKNNVKVGSVFLDSLRDARLSTISNVSRVLICHGTADERIPLTTSQLFVGRCANAKLEIFEGANHSFGSEHRAQLISKYCNWLTLSSGPITVEEPSPGKRARHRHRPSPIFSDTHPAKIAPVRS